MALADDRDDGGAPGEADLGDRAAGGGRLGGEGDLDEPGVAPLELEEPDERADRDRLLDEGGEEVGGGDGDVDPPGLVEEPVVLRVVDPGDHPGDGELLLGEERDDEVVLVVAGGGDDDVGLARAATRWRTSTSQASAATSSTLPPIGRRLDVGEVLLDEQDLRGRSRRGRRRGRSRPRRPRR